MLKLKRYLKPYWMLLICAVAFLFGQAMLELTLPNMMSDIVNVGIQQGGITEVAPKAISADGMALMQAFMSEEDRATAEEQYARVEDTSPYAQAYPNLAAGDYILKENADTTAADAAFSRAGYACVQVMQGLAAQNSAPAQGESAAGLEVGQLAQLLPMLAQLPADTVQNAIQTAAAAPDMALEQTASVFTKSFYVQLGADTDAMQTNYILIKGLEMLGFTVLLTACAIAAGFCLARMGAGVGRDLRRDVFRRVTYFTTGELDQFSTASLITRTTNDITQVQMFLSMGLRMMCFAPIMGVGGLIMGLSKCVSMAWILLLALIVMLGVILVLFMVALPRFKKMQQFIDKLNLVSREHLSGLMVIRAFATQAFEQERFDKANKDLTSNTLFVNRAMVTMMPVMTLVMNGVSLLIVWVGGHQIAQSTMQVGDMMAFIQYAMQVIMSFLFISMMFVMVPRASVSAERVHEVLATRPSVRDKEQPRHLPQPVRGVVEFRDVSFRYGGADEPVLHHVSFTAKPGQTTAFIGSTGSGKSTLVNLIPRFYDVSEGSILLDGIDVRDVPQKELRAAIGYVPQKGMLFSGSIASNLRYGDEKASDEALRTACDVAQATEFVSGLPEGLDTYVSQGGTSVSGGQRQRLSIARALVKKAPVYIFDDTFSALDFKTDARLRRPAIRTAPLS